MIYFAAGDAPFYFREQMASLSWFPRIWESMIGFGDNHLARLWIDYPFRLLVKVCFTLGMEWGVIEKLIWLGVILIGITGIYTLTKYMVGKRFSWVAVIIYLTNTYALLLFGGGQLGIAMAYALAPLVLLSFIRCVDNQSIRRVNPGRLIKNGLLLALLVCFDLRIAYLVMGAVVLYQVLRGGRQIIVTFFIPLLIAAGIHMFWILPLLLAPGGGTAGLSDQFTSPGMLKFLSFADISHALSLLHPNWPENLFGKVYFMQPEFLVMPIIAFSALLFVKAKEKVYILYFAFLSVIGVFFSKGVIDPAGGIFQWMFMYIPGFVMFRDPTKFYLLTALGYSILIPFALEGIARKTHLIVTICFIGFWFFTIRPLFLGQLTGNFRPQSIPPEYMRLKDLLVGDMVPSRTLWIPQKENFAFSSDTHPVLTATTAATIDHSVKYIVLPTDVNKSIFLNDYKYDPAIREKLIAELTAMRLRRDNRFSDLVVFENPSFTVMKSFVPEIVSTQQQLADVGLIISSFVIFPLIGWLLYDTYMGSKKQV